MYNIIQEMHLISRELLSLLHVRMTAVGAELIAGENASYNFFLVFFPFCPP